MRTKDKIKIERANAILEQEKLRRKDSKSARIMNIVTIGTLIILVGLAAAALIMPEPEKE